MGRKRKPRRAYPWQRRRRLAVMFIVGVAVVIGALVAARPSADEEVQRFLAELKARGAPTNTEELKAWLAVRRPEQSEPAEWEAVNRIPFPAGCTFENWEIDPTYYTVRKRLTIADVVLREAGDDWREETRRQARDFLKSNAAQLECLRALGKRIEAGATPPMGTKNESAYRRTRKQRDLIGVAAVLAARDGDFEQAGEYLVLLFQLEPWGRAMMAPYGLHYGCGLKWYANTVRLLLPAIVSMGRLNDAHLEEIAGRLLELKDRHVPGCLFTVSRAQVLETIDTAKGVYGHWELEPPEWAEPVYPGLYRDGINFLDAMGFYEADRLAYIKAVRRIEDLLKKPPHVVLQELPYICAPLHMNDDAWMGYDLTRYRAMAWGSIYRIIDWHHDRALAVANAAIAAVELYRNRTGTLPARLEAMPAPFSSLMAQDPYTGTLPRYRRLPEAGYEITCISGVFDDTPAAVSRERIGNAHRLYDEVSFAVRR